jgi:hypothetical protein
MADYFPPAVRGQQSTLTSPLLSGDSSLLLLPPCCPGTAVYSYFPLAVWGQQSTLTSPLLYGDSSLLLLPPCCPGTAVYSSASYSLITTLTSWRIDVLFYKSLRAVPWLRSLVAGLSPRRPRFAPGSIRVGFVVDKVALEQVFLKVLRFSPVNISFHRRSPNSYHLGNA